MAESPAISPPVDSDPPSGAFSQCERMPIIFTSN